MNNIIVKAFREIDLQDSFFQSLKEDYPGFDAWFVRKKEQQAYVQYDDNNKLVGFLYLKEESICVEDVTPSIYAERILKIGTFKINAHGTKMGEQFVKIITDYALRRDVDVCYVTIFEKHQGLISLVEQFGFNYFGTKGEGAHMENVYVKPMKYISGDINRDFPRVNTQGVNKYLLSIYPKYHSIMFPDSILRTENPNIITDVSYTNSIHKIYVCSLAGIEELKYGDILVLYRTAENGKSAEYSSVVTSICVVEEIRSQSEFDSFDSFYEYVSKYSVFDREDLLYWYKKGACKTIKMTYNVALKKRIVRHDLVEKLGLERDKYWGFFELTEGQFWDIVKAGEVNSCQIV